jgi:hypothetical protein
MTTKNPIISFPVDEETLKRIDDYRRTVEGRIPSRAESCRRLILEGLSRHEKKGKK